MEGGLSASAPRDPRDVGGWTQPRTFTTPASDRVWIAAPVVLAAAAFKLFDPGPRAAIGEPEALVFAVVALCGLMVFVVAALVVHQRVLRRYPSRVRIDPVVREVTLERDPRDRRPTERWGFAELTEARKGIWVCWPVVELWLGDRCVVMLVGKGEGDPLAASLMAAARATGVPD